MHTYRAASIDEWRKFLGVTSRRHDHQSRYPVKKVAPEHPILKGMPEDWVSPKDELYVIEKMWPGATPLATSVSEADGKSYPVAWVNGFGKARVFGTTFGHSDATFQDPVFLEMLSRGFLWAVASDSLVDRRSAGPLGDRSLPRRSSGSLRVTKNQLSVMVRKLMKPAGLKTTENNEGPAIKPSPRAPRESPSSPKLPCKRRTGPPRYTIKPQRSGIGPERALEAIKPSPRAPRESPSSPKLPCERRTGPT